MLDKILNYYNQRNVSLPQKEIDVIADLITFRKLNKKEYFYKKDDSQTSLAYILKGSVRIFIEDEAKNQHNRHFAFEEDWIGEIHQIMNDLNSKTSVQAIEKTELIEVSQKAFKTILKKCPVFTEATLNFYLLNYAKLLENEELKKTFTIEELYTDLKKNRPEIVARIPLYHIASYLGVKPESLSRVKKKFKETTV
ncbi:Crp/Fnr family transcriptional regulator [Ochrovirga pacifica]|uniref:Crp/Fnr family transcriptional regulator n=1 Tax=Ochrovirga pacifica TaxID=1042376 RepID=UPI000255A80E|nr:Crp/Fnr family transcriptional regulator [Ochrovirga pacifica]